VLPGGTSLNWIGQAVGVVVTVGVWLAGGGLDRGIGGPGEGARAATGQGEQHE